MIEDPRKPRIEVDGASQETSILQIENELAVGIDFGTTFTGVAYALSLEGTRDMSRPDSELYALMDKVFLIKSWPMANYISADKTPTCLAYDIDCHTIDAWGERARVVTERRPDDLKTEATSMKSSDPRKSRKIRIEHFKLGLHEEAGAIYFGKSKLGHSASLFGGFAEDHKWRHPSLPTKTAFDYTVDYLKAVREHVCKTILPRQLGEEVLGTLRLSFALTVPAMWTDKAKELTRQAAEKSGIPKDRLVIVTEPEAAALYCAMTCKAIQKYQSGDHFVLCDAGGGTVDLITYEIVSQNPFEIVECTPGTGSACGSIFLNKGFENLVRSRLGDEATILTTPRLEEAINMFENRVKAQFNPLSEYSGDDEYYVPLPGAPDRINRKLRGGFLEVTRKEIESIFDPVFKVILSLVRDQLRKANNNRHSAVFLVGGLGSNDYLAKYLEKELQASGIEIIQPPYGVSSIARGAVLHKLGLNYVKERVLRSHYGVITQVPFEQGRHPEDKRISSLSGEMCKNVMKWYAKKGDRIREGHVRKFYFQLVDSHLDNPGPVFRKTTLFYCDADTAPDYWSQEKVKQLCTVTVDIKKLPPDAFRVLRNIHGEPLHLVQFQIAVVFGAVLEFQFLWGGQVVGEVQTDYR